VTKSGGRGDGGDVAPMRDRKCALKVSVVKYEGRRLLLIPRHRWKDNIKMDLQEIGWEVLDWIDLDQNRWRW